jgi:phage baseplate assembly protein V
MATGADRLADRRFGVVEAEVVEVNDTENQGRVKVRFPWFDENMVTEWCRVCQFYAGNDYGAVWTPEVGTEVLVAFIHGDMRQPIVIGGLYNGVDKPATQRTKEKDEKLIRTKAGHEILLADTKDQERIVILDKSKKHRIEISTKDKSITIKSDGGKLSLAAKDIEIKADNSLKIQAKTVEETASSSLKSEAGKIAVKASGQIQMDASGQMTLTGATINLN